MSNEKSALGKISSSLETLKVLGDPYIYKQALAIEQGVKEMVAVNSPLVEQYGESMKKLLAIILCVSMMAGMCAFALAEEQITLNFQMWSDEEEVFKIVTTVRGNSLAGLISIDSPVGKALMGHKVGDTVSVQVGCTPEVIAYGK